MRDFVCHVHFVMDCVVSERPLTEKGVASFINYFSVYRSGKFDFDFNLCYLSYIVWTVWNGLNIFYGE